MDERLWPLGTRLDEAGELWLGGCAASALARQFGTPLYVFHETTLREGARAYRNLLLRCYPGSSEVTYAAKAYLCLALAQLFNQEGLGLDVVSGGELHVALKAGFPPARIHFHGNNKSQAELAEALTAGVGRIVVDNFDELAMLAEMAPAASRPTFIWLRLSPGIQAHTHSHIQTGHEDTKFGFSIASGDAERAVTMALRLPGLVLAGLHTHIGSQIYEPEALAAAASRVIEFAALMRERHGFQLRELSPGGGWGVPMTESDPPAPLELYLEVLCGAVIAACQAHGLELPHLVLEPGRSLVARAGVALYRVGARKHVPGVRTFVSVDGGMADNIRPALYGASYTALAIRPGRRQEEARREVVTIAGRFCESGDILIRDIELPELRPGDLLAVPMAGAYTLAMASNYNLVARPAVVLVDEGRARVIQRRETYDDLTARDLPLEAGEDAIPDSSAVTIHALSRPDADPFAGLPWGYLKPFYKYHALGNDYIVLDAADWHQPPTPEQVRYLCDRHRGVGGDGVLWGPAVPRGPGAQGASDQGTGPLAERVQGDQRPFGLRLFNPDGQEFEKSGNGVRIFARYLWDRRLPAGPDFVIHTPGGLVLAHVLDPSGSRIRLEMGQVSFHSQAIPVSGPPREVVEEELTVAGRVWRITAVTVGNPHCVVFLDAQPAETARELGSLSAELAQRWGPELERLPLYPRRTNVQFAEVIDDHRVRMEIWERGAGYTLASGTSSCAVAAAAIRTGRCASPVTVQMPGGEMVVEIGADWSASLVGMVEPVCAGWVRVISSVADL